MRYAALTYVFKDLNDNDVYGLVMLGIAPQPHGQDVINANYQAARDSTGQAGSLKPGYVSAAYGEFDFRIL